MNRVLTGILSTFRPGHIQQKNVNCFLFSHGFILHLHTITFWRISNTYGGSVDLKTFKDKHFTLRSKTKFGIF